MSEQFVISFFAESFVRFRCYRAGKNAQVIPGSLLYEPLEIVDTVRFADFATMDLCGCGSYIVMPIVR